MKLVVIGAGMLCADVPRVGAGGNGNVGVNKFFEVDRRD
jgi:hypothetical protein